MKGGKKKSKYGYLPYSLIVIAVWGIVPAFAKSGELPGGITTALVNWFAVLGLSAVISLQLHRKNLKKQDFTSLNFRKLSLLGLIWPLGYSLAYFTSLQLGSASITTIVNYFWPIFVLGLMALYAKTNIQRILVFEVAGKTFSKKSWLFIALAVFAVIFPVLSQEKVRFLFIPIILAALAAFAQALYFFIGKGLKESDLITTFIISIVTAIGATIYVSIFDVFVFKDFILPELKSLGYVACIGLASNGIGFWAFLKATRLSTDEGSNVLCLVMMCLVPVIQVVMISLLNVESISFTRWISIIVISIALFGIRSFLIEKKYNPLR